MKKVLLPRGLVSVVPAASETQHTKSGVHPSPLLLLPYPSLTQNRYPITAKFNRDSFPVVGFELMSIGRPCIP